MLTYISFICIEKNDKSMYLLLTFIFIILCMFSNFVMRFQKKIEVRISVPLISLAHPIILFLNSVLLIIRLMVSVSQIILTLDVYVALLQQQLLVYMERPREAGLSNCRQTHHQWFTQNIAIALIRRRGRCRILIKVGQ